MILIYTAILGPIKDSLWPAPSIPGVRFVALLPTPFLPDTGKRVPSPLPSQANGWEIRTISMGMSPRREARWWKTHPENVYDTADISVWIDGTMQCKFQTREALDKLLQAVDAKTPIACFKHSERTCYIQEVQECVRLKKDDPAILQRQLEAYLSRGLPPFRGLAETGVVVRKHGVEASRFNYLWWEEIQKHSQRDQISFPFVSWQTCIPWNRLPGTCYRNEFFEFHRHQS